MKVNKKTVTATPITETVESMSPYNAYTDQSKYNDSGDYTIILHGLSDIANT